MFRRTDCHFAVTKKEYDQKANKPKGKYYPHVTELINACRKTGRVALDVENPRICVRGGEDKGKSDLGYEFLPKDEFFPFYELRAAALDLRKVKGRPKPTFCPIETRRRIDAQLDTLIEKNLRHVVLSARCWLAGL